MKYSAPRLTQQFQEKKGDKWRSRPPMDNMLMFKIMLLQEWYHIADDMTEYLINDCLSFQRFWGCRWAIKFLTPRRYGFYREMLKNSGKSKELFDMFAALMEQVGVIVGEGSIVDASFVDVPKQRNNRDENKKIKEGDGE